MTAEEEVARLSLDEALTKVREFRATSKLLVGDLYSGILLVQAELFLKAAKARWGDEFMSQVSQDLYAEIMGELEKGQ
jgi:hypothetical protein